MIHITNDREEAVIAIGNEISPARMACKYPETIKTIASMSKYELEALCDAINDHRESHCTMPGCNSGRLTDGYDTWSCPECGKSVRLTTEQ